MIGLRESLKQYPAPWQFEMVERFSNESEDALSISDANGSSIAEMQCPRDVEESLARLMTAAPLLYEALQRMDALVENLFKAVPWGQTFDVDFQLLNEAPIAAKRALALAKEKS